jgi:hypothetical protein
LANRKREKANLLTLQMQSSLTDYVIKICSDLNRHSVQYLIVGGAAVAMYGYERQSRGPFDLASDKIDIDFWYNPSYPNYYKLLSVLDEWGEDIKQYREQTTPDPLHSFFRLEYADYTVDFLPVIGGLGKFKDCFAKSDVRNQGNTQLYFLGFEELILSKQYLGRPKDFDDIEQLKKLRDRNKED